MQAGKPIRYGGCFPVRKSRPAIALAARRFANRVHSQMASISRATACFARQPRLFALELADGNFFRPLDAEKLGLENALVVLSACDSGAATESEGDEVFGLVRAFLIGGASRVVASLWPVDDEATVDWMSAFYRALQSGATPASAGQQAQRAVREQHPPISLGAIRDLWRLVTVGLAFRK